MARIENNTGTTSKLQGTVAVLTAASGSTSIWWYPNINPGDAVINYLWEWAVGPFTQCFSLQHFSNGNFYGGWSVSGDQRAVIADTGLFTKNVWVNVVLTYSSAGTTLYFGGTAVKTNVNAPVIADSPSTLTIGESGPASTGAVAGTGYAEMAAWNVVLTQGEITALAKGARAYTIRPLASLGYWPLDGLQSPEPDLSGKAANLTVTACNPFPGPPLMPFTPRWRQFNAVAAAAPPTILFRKTLSQLGGRVGSRQPISSNAGGM